MIKEYIYYVPEVDQFYISDIQSIWLFAISIYEVCGLTEVVYIGEL